MKGVINKGIQELVERRFGSEVWDAVCREAGCDEPSFSPSLDYSDQLTVDLITQAAKHASLSVDEVMVEFGKYWVSNTGKETYPALFALAGDNAREFLTSIDRVHAQVTLSIAGARPPRLTATDLPNGALAIHYVSKRNLCPVVRGLIVGVGEYFDEKLAVSETHCTRRGDSECAFEVRFS